MAIVLPEAARGALEDLCLAAVAGDPAMACVEGYFECLDSRGMLPRQISKGKLHAFLASRETPGRRLGEAAKAGDWPWDSDAFDGVKAFLRTVAE